MQRIRNQVILPENLRNDEKIGFVETLSFQQIVKHLFTEGTVPVPPNRPCAWRLCRITFSEGIAPGGCHSGGQRHHMPEPPKGVKKIV